MTNAVKAEIRKLMTTRLWWGMAIGVFLLAGLIALAFGGTIDPDGVDTVDGQGNAIRMTPAKIALSTYTGGIAFGYLLLLVIGITTMGAEYRHKTITASLLAVPRRGRLIAAKVIALLAFGIMYGLIFLLGSVGVGATVLSIRGLAVFPEPGTIARSLALMLLVLGLWALIGLGLGVLIPNQVAAILVGVAMAFIIEPIGAQLLANQSWGETLSQYFPSRATNAVLDSVTATGQEQLSWWAGALVLTAYAAVFVAIGTWLTKRRDVS